MNNPKMLSPITKVVDVSDMRQDKNGRNYKLFRLEGITETEEVIGGKTYTVKQRGKRVSITQYEESYLNGQPDPFFDAEIGEILGVEIYNAQVLPYQIEDPETGSVREVSSYTFPVIRGDNPMTVLENAEHRLSDTTSESSTSTTTESEVEEKEPEMSITQ